MLGRAETPTQPATARPGSSVSSWRPVTPHVTNDTISIQSCFSPFTEHLLSIYYVLDVVLGSRQAVVNVAQSPSPSREAVEQQ